MSQKRAKQLKKEVRKAAEAHINSEMSLIKQIVKPRPRWCPRWIWRQGMKIFFYDSIDYNPMENSSMKSLQDFVK